MTSAVGGEARGRREVKPKRAYRWTWLAGTLRVYAPAVTDIPLEDRVDGAFTPSDRDNTHLAALDIKSAAFDVAKAVSSQLRRLLDRTTDFD